ncbi:MoaD/ThiS family protein [Paeniglutamicibacter cryotolerans]|uniref:Molybdopterin converting factor small subunit n=1 Tax=Paeniglutamicibacter cryotolerans TaxID=670079 RepID=A0A839QNS5_9MICC|nr:MoaD/ThiS family protein [Paeniglutamicibacter cryotolerans]MBB2994862.1 molybdopterin converting factor small subunit [Paeniglutamicibacter cryotolerans]
MGSIIVELPQILSACLDGERRREMLLAGESTIGRVLEELGNGHPGFVRRVRDETGAVRRYVNVFVGRDNIRDLDGLATTVRDGDTVMIIASVAGG